jgi:hypothetical protein
VSPSFAKSVRVASESQSACAPRSARKPFAATVGDRADRALPGRVRPSHSPGTPRSEHAATTSVEERASAALPKMVVQGFSALRPSFTIGELTGAPRTRASKNPTATRKGHDPRPSRS